MIVCPEKGSENNLHHVLLDLLCFDLLGTWRWAPSMTAKEHNVHQQPLSFHFAPCKILKQELCIFHGVFTCCTSYLTNLFILRYFLGAVKKGRKQCSYLSAAFSCRTSRQHSLYWVDLKVQCCSAAHVRRHDWSPSKQKQDEYRMPKRQPWDEDKKKEA